MNGEGKNERKTKYFLFLVLDIHINVDYQIFLLQTKWTTKFLLDMTNQLDTKQTSLVVVGLFCDVGMTHPIKIFYGWCSIVLLCPTKLVVMGPKLDNFLKSGYICKKY